ncbi:Cyclic di-GMP phosphodiesterase Gmr [compost metagenome]
MEMSIHYVVHTIASVLLVGLLFRLRSLLAERTKLRELAYRDPVTGLLNRNGLDHFWHHYKGKENLAVLSLDLDRFKEINDTYGHKAGDQILHEVSQVLNQVTNKNQLAFRVGGDEFLFIMKNCHSNKVEIIANLILDKMSRPFHIQGRDLSVTGSIGISMSPGARADRLRMLEEADIAMYHAKRLGKNRYCVYRNDRNDADPKQRKTAELTLVKRNKVSSS